MTSKKIIKEFNPENSSYLHHGDDDDIISSWITEKDQEELQNSIFTPINFNDLENIHSLRKEYSQNNLKTPLSRKFVKEIIGKELDFVDALLYAGFPLWTISFLLINNLYNYIGNDFIYYIVNIITLFFILIGITVIFPEDSKSVYNEEKYNLTKNTRKQLHNNIFLKLPINTTHSIKNTHNNIMSKINQIFSYDEDILNTIDFYDLKKSYNEYVQLLTFIVINEDNISFKLYEDYTKYLEELSQEINQEIDNILTIIKMKKEFVYKNEKEISEINQELLDNDALSFFPMNNKEKSFNI